MPRELNRKPKHDVLETIEVRPEVLRVGMYIDLNCSWFKHPFPRRTFRIASHNQIATICGLGLGTVLVYPRQSDPGVAEDSASLASSTPGNETSNTGAEVPTDDPLLADTPAPQPTSSDYHQAAELASEAYRQVIQRSSQMMKDLSSGSPEGLRNAKVMINGLSTLLHNTEAAGMVASAFNPEDIDNLNALHALNVATLSMMVAQHLDLKPDSVQLIGMAGLLLDIGEQRISSRIVRNRHNLTPREMKEYHLHPYHAIDMLRRYPGFPEEVLDIIRGHHERLDGSGYPERLKGEQIPLPTRIVSAVDQYDSLINHPDSKQAVSPAEALAKMYKYQQHVFAPDVVVSMIQAFGVYPPGTVVTLSDGTVGLVLNINFETRLKPLVLLYEPAASRENPTTIDLSSDSQLTILRAMPRAELSQEITDYFHIKRWTGYFIQSSMRTVREEPSS